MGEACLAVYVRLPMKLWDEVSKLKAEAYKVTHSESLAYLSKENVAISSGTGRTCSSLVLT
jgi:hypothetical protein